MTMKYSCIRCQKAFEYDKIHNAYTYLLDEVHFESIDDWGRKEVCQVCNKSFSENIFKELLDKMRWNSLVAE